jgi:hypothetical protein
VSFKSFVKTKGNRHRLLILIVRLQFCPLPQCYRGGRHTY